MSDLHHILDYESDDFIHRVHGLFLHGETLYNRAGKLRKHTEERVFAMERNCFGILAELGEALLFVQESQHAIGKTFEDWFERHNARIPFSLSHSDRCKRTARAVREHGLENAFLLAQQKSAEQPAPLLSATLRLVKPFAELSDEEKTGLRKRILPWVQGLWPGLNVSADV